MFFTFHLIGILALIYLADYFHELKVGPLGDEERRNWTVCMHSNKMYGKAGSAGLIVLVDLLLNGVAVFFDAAFVVAVFYSLHAVHLAFSVRDHFPDWVPQHVTLALCYIGGYLWFNGVMQASSLAIVAGSVFGILWGIAHFTGSQFHSLGDWADDWHHVRLRTR